MPIIHLEEVRQNIIHYGGLSAYFSPGEKEEIQLYRKKIFSLIQVRLAKLRNNSQNTDDLQWHSAEIGWRPIIN